MQPIDIRYAVQPSAPTAATSHVADLFGLAADEPPHVVADNLQLDIRPGDVVLFSGPSGSGKSSLLRAASGQLGAVDALSTDLPELPIIEALPGSSAQRLQACAAFGLSEARLMLRTPRELSDGQRHRFRLAWAAAERPPGSFIAVDEFAANLERTLAKVLAYNVRQFATRTGVGLLLATTHEDIVADLRPDLHVRCRGDGDVQQIRDDRARRRRSISFVSELSVVEGRARDWPRFARWHYRSRRVAFVRRVVLLKHGGEPIGICVFVAPAATLSIRARYFGCAGARSRLGLRSLNEQLWLLARVVIHPTYRGAGLAAPFVRFACRTCPAQWIETLCAMGQANPLFERAGFRRVGVLEPGQERKRPELATQYATDSARYSLSAIDKSRRSAPVYYVFDNRR